MDWSKLSGWKTYAAAVGSILVATAAYANGTMDLATYIQTVSVAILAITGRHALAKK